MTTWTAEQNKFIYYATRVFGEEAEITQEQVKKIVENKNAGLFPYWFISSDFRIGRNKYKLPKMDQSNIPVEQDTYSILNDVEADEFDIVAGDELEMPEKLDASMNFVPRKIPGYVPYGFFDDISRIVSSNMFMPVFISGWSGNGKTTMVEHACAISNRECIIANISIETDQSDLIGGPTLVNGNVINRDGPIILAMRRGAILLLDEIDRGSNKLLCLQTILEGKPYLNKQTNELIYPKKGFNIIATSNTKGKGSEDGRYLSTILDDAFLERFPITIEQEFAPNNIEKKIVLNALKLHNAKDDDFANVLIKWSDRIRKAAKEQVVDDVISTRRLCHIASVYGIFKDRQKSIDYCISRFDENTKKSFSDFYKMLETPKKSVDILLADDIPF